MTKQTGYPLFMVTVTDETDWIYVVGNSAVVSEGVLAVIRQDGGTQTVVAQFAPGEWRRYMRIDNPDILKEFHRLRLGEGER